MDTQPVERGNTWEGEEGEEEGEEGEVGGEGGRVV